MEPKFVITDFESAAISSIKKSFPTALPQGCFFHFTQSVYRGIQRAGLQTQYNENADIAMQLNMLMTMAFLPTTDIREAFKQLIKFGIFDMTNRLNTSNTSSADSISSHLSHAAPPDTDINSDSRNQITQLIKYFSDTWLGGTVNEAKYPVSLWNMYDAVRANRARTNNSVEAWHNAINRCVGKKGNIYKFFEFLQKEEGLAHYKNQQNIDSGRNQSNKRKKYATRDIKIQNIVLSYTKNTEKMTYLKSLSKYVQVVQH